jgi:hypothetical protein
LIYLSIYLFIYLFIYLLALGSALEAAHRLTTARAQRSKIVLIGFMYFRISIFYSSP